MTILIFDQVLLFFFCYLNDIRGDMNGALNEWMWMWGLDDVGWMYAMIVNYS